MNSKFPKKRTPQEEIEQLIALKYDYAFLRPGGKSSLLLNMTFLGGPFFLLILFMTYIFKSTPLWPLLIAACINGFWALFIALKHHSMNLSDYRSLSKEEQSIRILYDSMWVHIYKGGLILYASIIYIWSIIEISFTFGMSLIFTFVYISLCLLCWSLCIRKRDWLITIYIEGPEVHTWLKTLIQILLFLIVGLTAMSGIVRLSQVFLGEETTKWTFLPLVVVVLGVFASAGFIYSLISFKIAGVQHEILQVNSD